MNKKESYSFILASQSPRRKELLSHLEFPFKIQVSHVEEADFQLGQDPKKYCLNLAKSKGAVVASQQKSDSLVLSADTIVELNGTVLNKPTDTADASRMLQALAGKVHSVFTGICFFENGKLIHDQIVQTKVDVAAIDSETLQLYLQTGDSMDKAGAYGIQGMPQAFISAIHGSYSNVVGLPLYEVQNFLKNWGGEKWRNRFI